MKLHEVLTERRNALGMNLQTLSELSGVPKGTVNKIMSGASPNPGITPLMAIAHALGLSLDDLTEKEAPPDECASVHVDDVEAELLAIYRDLNPTGQTTLLNVARGLAANPDMKGGSASNTVTA
jgi:transcriptional regulator with XRE-family HTH domain